MMSRKWVLGATPRAACTATTTAATARAAVSGGPGSFEDIGHWCDRTMRAVTKLSLVTKKMQVVKLSMEPKPAAADEGIGTRSQRTWPRYRWRHVYKE
jgi:hypothetical protein